MEVDEAEPKVGRRVNAQLKHDERLYRSVEGGRSTRQPAWFDDWEDDD